VKIVEKALIKKPLIPEKNKIYFIREDGTERPFLFATIYEDIHFFKFLFRKIIKKFKRF
jgi:hypothetical protein